MKSNVELAEFAQRLKRTHPEVYRQCRFYYGNPEEPSHTVKANMPEKYAVCLFAHKKVLIVWNYEQHKKNKEYGAAQHSLTLGRTWDAVLTSDHTVTFPYYKKLGTQKNAPYEKIYVVHIDDWQWFFSDINKYMEFNDYDRDEHGKPLPIEIIPKDVLEKDECIRKRYSSQKIQRKADFREQVLSVYGTRCAICRCNVSAILQAAHLHGCEVAETDLSADKVENGICLCANHHLMYDNNLIDIDILRGEVYILDDAVKQMPWYDKFTQNGSKLVKIKKEH